MFTSKLETSSAFVDFPNDLTYRRVGLVLNPFDYNTTTVCSQNTRSAVKAMIFPQTGIGTPTGNFPNRRNNHSSNLRMQKDLWFHMMLQLKF